MSWKYRGQVIPSNHVVVVDVELTEVRDEVCDGVPARVVVAEGSLWVDGKRIYEAGGPRRAARRDRPDHTRGLSVRALELPAHLFPADVGQRAPCAWTSRPTR